MTICKITGYACNCQPDEGIPCNGVERLRESYQEWRTRAEQMEAERDQLRGNLSLAEEGLANYQQENAQLRSTLAYRLQELDNAKWLIRNGEKHFGSLWRDAIAEDINAITRRAPPQPGEQTAAGPE